MVEHAGGVARVADLVLAASIEAIAGNPSVLDAAVLRREARAGPARRGRRASARSSTAAGCSRRAFPRRCRTRCRSASARRSTARSASSSRILRGRGGDRAQRHGRQPARRRRVGTDAQQRQLPPDGARARLDALRPAIAHVGQLSDRRMNHLWSSVADVFFGRTSRRPDRAGRGPAPLHGPRRATELRLHRGPATLDIGLLDLGVEDHATNAAVTAQRSERRPRPRSRTSSRSSSDMARTVRGTPGRSSAPGAGRRRVRRRRRRAAVGRAAAILGRDPRGRPVRTLRATPCSRRHARRSRAG